MEVRNNKGQFVKGSGLKDITGQRYGKLVVIKHDHTQNHKSYWLCRCDCGNEKVIRSDCLNRIQSCGCVKKEQDYKNLGIDHHNGYSNHPAYSIWNGIYERCMNPNCKTYEYYGGRGIKLCDEWINPEGFCKWADETGYEKGKNLSIERIDVNGNYEPSNCIWIDRSDQVYNRRNTVFFMDSDGQRKSLSKEARKAGIAPDKAHDRYQRGIRNPEVLLFKGNIKDCEAYEERYQWMERGSQKLNQEYSPS